MNLTSIFDTLVLIDPSNPPNPKTLNGFIHTFNQYLGINNNVNLEFGGIVLSDDSLKHILQAPF